eukprot:gb/GFBE01027074.1/.p1 GENE.gb/GFBE01027074.1/~~gb/GFBE01027074.1/.p1  ORF type:complete len:184 (+),score=19.21 gb/GFBE01027074.1/:1-552(+)
MWTRLQRLARIPRSPRSPRKEEEAELTIAQENSSNNVESTDSEGLCQAVAPATLDLKDLDLQLCRALEDLESEMRALSLNAGRCLHSLPRQRGLLRARRSAVVAAASSKADDAFNTEGSCIGGDGLAKPGDDPDQGNSGTTLRDHDATTQLQHRGQQPGEMHREGRTFRVKSSISGRCKEPSL